jgi:hypothetical protein
MRHLFDTSDLKSLVPVVIMTASLFLNVYFGWTLFKRDPVAEENALLFFGLTLWHINEGEYALQTAKDSSWRDSSALYEAAESFAVASEVATATDATAPLAHWKTQEALQVWELYHADDVFDNFSSTVESEMRNLQAGEPVDPTKMEVMLELIERADLPLRIEMEATSSDREQLHAVGERFRTALQQCTDSTESILTSCANE